jgi:hypothetical protein
MMRFARRVYVRKATVMTERIQKMLDKTNIARGKPVGRMLPALGSTDVSIATCSRQAAVGVRFQGKNCGGYDPLGFIF